MNLVFSPSETPRDQLSFSIKRKDVQHVLSIVLVVHVLVFLLAFFGLPDFKIAKRPDITIEIGAAPPESSGPANQAKPTPVPVQKEVPKEKPPPLS